MPVLNWIGKEAVVRHHKDVPFRLLEPVPELSCGPVQGKESGNLIVQDDNLHALKALLPRYAGQVKCIYIDPPYNTGNEGWVYNDNVNSPEIRLAVHDVPTPGVRLWVDGSHLHSRADRQASQVVHQTLATVAAH